MNPRELVARLENMADKKGRNDYSIGDYWNAVSDAAERIVALEGLLGAANNALSHQASLLSAKDREIAELEAKYAAECDASMMTGSQNSALRLQVKDAEERASRWAKIADQRAIEVADLKVALAKHSLSATSGD